MKMKLSHLNLLTIPKNVSYVLVLMCWSLVISCKSNNEGSQEANKSGGLSDSDKFAGSCLQAVNGIAVCLESYNISQNQAKSICEATDPQKVKISGVSGSSTFQLSRCSDTGLTAKCLFTKSGSSTKNIQFNYGRRECPPGSSDISSSISNSLPKQSGGPVDMGHGKISGMVIYCSGSYTGSNYAKADERDDATIKTYFYRDEAQKKKIESMNLGGVGRHLEAQKTGGTYMLEFSLNRLTEINKLYQISTPPESSAEQAKLPMVVAFEDQAQSNSDDEVYKSKGGWASAGQVTVLRYGSRPSKKSCEGGYSLQFDNLKVQIPAVNLSGSCENEKWQESYFGSPTDKQLCE